ncbi:unnamed protein product [Adineta steineri]|uniref:NHL repeat containing protein n=1 Tax=Adineta steineri TaxID=433720 RepID=A0A819ST42_9BILA|nr:unnamed protein product [Adineta steineri]
MAMTNNKAQCFKCGKNKITYSCEGCSKHFCLMDLIEHRQILNDELNHIINNYDQFKQTINEEKQNPQNPQNPSLIRQIDRWETNSIEKIQQKAQEYREIVIKSLQTFINDIENKFNDLNEQIKQFHIENEFNEINLNYLRNQLIEITEELNNPTNIPSPQDSSPFITDISIFLSKKPRWDKWKQNAITVAGGNGQGQQLNQLNSPAGIFIDKKKNIFIAELDNHRIVEWKHNAKEGQLIAGGNGEGNRMDQLNYPTNVIIDQQNHSVIIADYRNGRVIQWLNQKQQLILIDNISCYGLAMDKHEFLYVSNYMKSEVRRWKMGEYNEGIVVAGGNGRGNRLNQLNSPTYIFVDEDQSVYVTDSQIYVADYGNHRVMRWCEGKEEGEIIVGGNGPGNQSNQVNCPCGLCFDDEENLYVVDFNNHRLQKFEILL